MSHTAHVPRETVNGVIGSACLAPAGDASAAIMACGVAQFLGDLGVNVHSERDGAVTEDLADDLRGCPAARSILAAPCLSP